MRRVRHPVWWHPLLPAGLWLRAADLTLGAARLSRRLGFRSPRSVFALLRLSSALSRAGFASWRFWGVKWR